MSNFIYKAKAIDSLRPNAQWAMSDGVLSWLDAAQSQPTDEEINAEIERIKQYEPLQACKDKAKALIAATDWAVLPDVGLANQDAFVFYRLNLRNLIKNPVVDPVFEAEPTPVWS